MADTVMFPVAPGFNLQELTAKVMQTYQFKGFAVNAVPMGAGVSIDFRKGDSGITKYLGLALGIRANIMLQNGILVVNFCDAEWTGKIIGLAIGWIICFIPFITAIVGCVQQSALPTSIGNDIQMISSSVVPPNAPVGGYQPAPFQATYPHGQNPSTAPQTQFCGRCGALVDIHAQVCPHCGAPVH